MVSLDCFGLMRKLKRRRKRREEGATSVLSLLTSGFFNGGKATLIVQVGFEEGTEAQTRRPEDGFLERAKHVD